ncbi:hypothetical protein AB0D60_01050 [Streptomyces sp. NPDC048306]|uniref:DUF6907 domain-containing protein n=1 Tax=Streptomyces sp. NPDC048306 TaxID=3154502 RepID=UPI0033EB2F01
MTQHLPRQATVSVLVVKGLQVDEPDWCAGHSDGRAQFKPDITHNGPETSATFHTPDGAYTYLRAWITQAPYGEAHPEPLPLLAVEIDGDMPAMTPEAVRAFTTTTRERLAELDALADELARLRGEDR